MAKIKGAIVVDIDGCKGCGLCIEACPVEVISLSDNVNVKGYHYSYMTDPDACTGCSNCAIICPDGIITVYRIKI
ncbi:MAG: ferredoxin family protein [Bacteroidetes bacterium]|nr:ferredoxin family protein [Bacteroidota bacterium]